MCYNSFFVEGGQKEAKIFASQDEAFGNQMNFLWVHKSGDPFPVAGAHGLVFSVIFSLSRPIVVSCWVGQPPVTCYSTSVIPRRSKLNSTSTCSHRIHVWHIYLHLVDFYGKLVGKYTSHMDPMGLFHKKHFLCLMSHPKLH